jgi:hypothetical protein
VCDGVFCQQVCLSLSCISSCLCLPLLLLACTRCSFSCIHVDLDRLTPPPSQSVQPQGGSCIIEWSPHFILVVHRLGVRGGGLSVRTRVCCQLVLLLTLVPVLVRSCIAQVKDILAYLKLAVNNDDIAAFHRVVRDDSADCGLQSVCDSASHAMNRVGDATMSFIICAGMHVSCSFFSPFGPCSLFLLRPMCLLEDSQRRQFTHCAHTVRRLGRTLSRWRLMWPRDIPCARSHSLRHTVEACSSLWLW